MVIVNDSTFHGNESNSVGGAISVSDANRFEINHSTIANNSGEYAALFVFRLVGGTVVRNSIIADNIGRNTSFGRFPDFGFGASSRRDFQYSLFENGDSITGRGNIVGQAPGLGPLADNGGPTLTVAILPNSPAIDAGNGALLPSGATKDQRGVERIIDLPNTANAIGGDGTVIR